MYGMRWKPQWMESLPRMETFWMSTMVDEGEDGEE